MSTHTHWHRMIERRFEGKLTSNDVEALHVHLRDCAECRALYDQYAQMEQALYPEGDEVRLTPFAQDRIAERLLGPDLTTSTAPLWRRLGPGLMAAAALATALIALRPSEPEYVARGPDTALSADTGMRLLRVRTATTGLSVVDIGATAKGILPKDRLRFVYTNLGAYTELSLWAITAEGQVRSLHAPVSIESGGEQVPIKAKVTVPNDWPPGPVRFVALFSTDGLRDNTWKDDIRPQDTEVMAIRMIETTFTKKEVPNP